MLLFVVLTAVAVHQTRGKVLQSPASEVNGNTAREALAGSRLAAAQCESSMQLEDLQQGLQLGSQFLVRSQRPAGNFRYQYNWLSKSELDEDNPVRQAGTLWGLSLVHVDDPDIGLMSTIRKGLDYFDKHSVEFPGNVRLLKYPGKNYQKLGATALLALSHIEVLRKPKALLDASEETRLKDHLAGYLRGIVAAYTGNHSFHSFYHGNTGKPFGQSNPFYDGECLLVLVKAAKYLGRNDLWPYVKDAAEAGWQKYVLPGLHYSSKPNYTGKSNFLQRSDKLDTKKAQSDLALMGGYYQWATMAWYELLCTDNPDFASYGERMLRYTDAFIHYRSVGRKPNVNGGHNYEGIIPAFVVAVQQGNPVLEKKFGCAIHQGIENLHSLQVGHTKAYGLAEPLPPEAANVDLGKDERAQGGAQSKRNSALLRIDTTQHQLHALLMAKRLLQQQALI